MFPANFGYVAARSVSEARQILLRGFTTIRDMGGPAFGLDPQARLFAVFTDPADDYALLRDLSAWAGAPPSGD